MPGPLQEGAADAGWTASSTIAAMKRHPQTASLVAAFCEVRVAEWWQEEELEDAMLFWRILLTALDVDFVEVEEPFLSGFPREKEADGVLVRVSVRNQFGNLFGELEEKSLEMFGRSDEVVSLVKVSCSGC